MRSESKGGEMFVSGLEMTEEMPFNCVCVRVCVCVWVRERTVSH